MIDPRHEELLHKQLDGEATPAEEAELERLLADHGELRSRREELERLFGVLASTPAVVPTEGFAERILRGVRALPAYRPREPWTAALVRFFQPGWRPAAYFAAGALAAVALVAAFAPRLSLEDSAGTLLPEAHFVRGRVADRQVVQLQDGSATFRLRTAAAGIVWLEMDVRTESPLDVQLTFDPAELTPTGISFAPAGAHVVMDAALVHFENAARGDYRAAFSQRSAAAAVSIRVADGSKVVDTRLQTNPAGGGPSS